ncbi:trypsin epsilon [Spodoptera frugiperda]|uniref:trypsin n=1 Tax=Spodoptera frugiperda TaxID=7108 RepID=A0A9R0E3M6_SPOFR|nr:trypsin epsilon [Spodoptera frugiperda]
MINYLLIMVSLLGYIQCQKNAKIIGGYRADIEDFPHSMALYVVCNDISPHKESIYLCGASILRTDIALTAAHCVDNGCVFESSFYMVTAGSEQLKKGFKSSIKAVYYHKLFNLKTLDDDIAILRLTTKLQFSQKIMPVRIMSNPPYHEEALIAGWGLVQISPEKTTKILYATDQHVVRNNICDIMLSIKTKPGAFCAESKFKDSRSIIGDSGSALVVRGNIQIGICSYGVPEWSNSITVYTNISYYHKWINKGIRKLSRL